MNDFVTTRRAAAFVATLLVVSACSSEAPRVSGFTRLVDEARSCGVLTEGAFSGATLDVAASGSRAEIQMLNCYAGCAAVSCTRATSFFCGTDPSLDVLCISRCALPCSDGGGSFNIYEACDGTPQCDDASDELMPSCEAFACGDGSFVADAGRCDGTSDCSTAADEEGCTFSCGDGSSIGVEKHCDHIEQCANGADESDCGWPVFVCADGFEIAAELECDLSPDCADESDEHAGCAHLNPTACP